MVGLFSNTRLTIFQFSSNCVNLNKIYTIYIHIRKCICSLPQEKPSQTKPNHGSSRSIARKTFAALITSMALARNSCQRNALLSPLLLFSSLCSPPKDEKGVRRISSPHALPGSHVENFWWEAGWQKGKFIDQVCEPEEKMLGKSKNVWAKYASQSTYTQKSQCSAAGG